MYSFNQRLGKFHYLNSKLNQTPIRTQVKKGLLDKCYKRTYQSQNHFRKCSEILLPSRQMFSLGHQPNIEAPFSLKNESPLKTEALSPLKNESLLKNEAPYQEIIYQKKNKISMNVCVLIFLSAVCLPQGQLQITIKETASLTGS